MSRLRKYILATVCLLMFFIPPGWSLRLVMQVAKLRSALGPEGDWPADAVRWAIPDPKASWGRRMLVWAHELWLTMNGPRLGTAGVCRHLSVVGIEHLHEAVESGNGAIVIFAHQTGARAMGWIVKETGLPWSAVGYAGVQRKWTEQWWAFHWLHMWPHIWLHNRAFGARTLLRSDAAGIKQAYKRLRNGELVFMAQDLPGKRYRVRLLRREASLALGSVRMAMATGARLIPCAVVLTEHDELQVCFRPPIVPVGGEAQLAESVTRALEALILSGPELWWTEFVHPDTEAVHDRDHQPATVFAEH